MESSKTTIDDLPEEILRRILFFLPTIAAVQTSAISRKWCTLWRFVPILNFCMFDFYCHSPCQSVQETRQLFAEFVSRTLLQRPRHSPLEKFHLFFDYIDSDSMRAYVNSWVRYAIRSKATEIELDFDSNFAIFLLLRFGKHVDDGRAAESADDDDTYLYYDFHFSDLMNSRVQVLTLHGCNFCLPSNELAIKFDSLREIRLQNCYSSDEEIEDLMALCANVEFLSLAIIQGLQNLKIVSQKLKHLELGILGWDDSDQSSIEICAPSLTSIELNNCYAGEYIFRDTSSLVEADVKFDSRRWRDFAYWANVVSLLGGVQRLTVQNMWLWLVELLKLVLIAEKHEGIEKNPEVDSDEGLVNIEEGYHEPEVGSDGESVNGEEEYHEPELENDEEFVNGEEEYHGKLKLGEGVLSRNFAFNNLKFLELLTAYTRYDLLGLELILETCPRLETLVLHHFYLGKHDEHMEEEITETPIVLKMPCLRLVKMRNYTESKNELYVVGLLKRDGLVLEKIVTLRRKEDDGASSSEAV